MYNKFNEVGNYNWIKILPSLLKQYNERKHRTIGMAPVEVNKRNEAVVLKNLSKNRQHYKSVDRKINFKVGELASIKSFLLKDTYQTGPTKSSQYNLYNQLFRQHTE